MSRVETGPSVLKCRPITVSFRHFKDREDILKASKLLKVTEDNIHITEDVSKQTREAQQELRKFLRLARKSNPDIRGFIDYDKLYIDGDIFVYNKTKKAVELFSSPPDTENQER